MCPAEDLNVIGTASICRQGLPKDFINIYIYIAAFQLYLPYMLQILSATMIMSAKGGRSGRNFLLLLMCILCMLACAGGSRNVRVRCIESERQALLAFKKGLVDPGNRLASWTSGEEDC